MAVQDIECQIASVQIGRYLAGEQFSPVGLTQLEQHVAGCPHCQELLAKRRAALQAMLGKAVVEVPIHHAAVAATTIDDFDDEDETSEAPSAFTKLAKAVATARSSKKSTTTKPRRKSSAYKPIAYSSALAVVLCAMSLVSRQISDMMNSRGSAPENSIPLPPTTKVWSSATTANVPSAPAHQIAAAPAANPTPPVHHPPVQAPKKPPTTKPAAQPHAVSAPPPFRLPASAKPKAHAQRHAGGAAHRRRAGTVKKHAPTAPTHSIHVYGADGKPL